MWTGIRVRMLKNSHSPKLGSVRDCVSILSGRQTICLTDRPFLTNEVSVRRISKSCSFFEQAPRNMPSRPNSATDGFRMQKLLPLYTHNQGGLKQLQHSSRNMFKPVNTLKFSTLSPLLPPLFTSHKRYSMSTRIQC